MKYPGLIIVALISVIFIALSGSASADSFNPGRIIDDAVFDNANSMSAPQIDSFLNSFPNSCISTNSGFSALDPNGYNPSSGYLYGGYTSAGQIIYDAAQAYGINPQVLLATLQKEQSLVAGGVNYCNDGDQNKYSAAVGYGCPDSGSVYNYTGVSLYRRNGVLVSSTGPTCVNSAAKAGFSQQVIRGAWLLKFGEQRSRGNIGWSVVKGSWVNTDDPQTCYGGPMTQGYFQRCPGGSVDYYDGYISIDGTPVHLDSGGTAALYWYTPHFHGNQNFFNIFTGWFGSTILPNAFKIEGSPAIYVQAAGYRFYVPSISMLQDYGFGTGAQTISQATASNIPPPDGTTGLSSSIGPIVKSPSDTDSDGGSIYLMNGGRRYLFTTIQQMADYGYSSADITYLPLSLINSVNNAGVLSNFAQAPNYAIFQVSNHSRRLVLNGSTYGTINPSGALSKLTYNLLDSIPSDKPISNTETIIGDSTGALYLYVNNNYYYIPSPDILSCWGFFSTLGMGVYKLPADFYVAPIVNTSSLSCTERVDSTTSYLLNGSNRIPIPNEYGFNVGTTNVELNNVANKIPLRSNSLGRTVKSNSSPIVWYLENGFRKGVPSLVDLSLLGVPVQQIDQIQNGATNELPAAGIKMGVGQVVRSSDDGGVYVITSPTTKTWIASPDDFSAYGYSWGSLISFPSAVINSGYATNPNPLSNFLYNPYGGYLIDSLGCFGLSQAELTAFGQPGSASAAGQTYASTIFPYLNFTNCKNGSVYAKSPGNPTIYWIDGGQKHPISTWNKLLSHSGQSSPYIIPLSSSTLNKFPTGSVL